MSMGDIENKSIVGNKRRYLINNCLEIIHATILRAGYDNHKHDILMFPKKETNLFLNRVYDKIKNENPMP